MACNDGGVPYPPTREEELDAKVPIPALCAILKGMPAKIYLDMLGVIDWKEAGITKAEFIEWWKMHQARDSARKRAERSEKVQKNLRKQALDKLQKAGLSVAELRALKVK